SERNLLCVPSATLWRWALRKQMPQSMTVTVLETHSSWRPCRGQVVQPLRPFAVVSAYQAGMTAGHRRSDLVPVAEAGVVAGAECVIATRQAAVVVVLKARLRFGQSHTGLVYYLVVGGTELPCCPDQVRLGDAVLACLTDDGLPS